MNNFNGKFRYSCGRILNILFPAITLSKSNPTIIRSSIQAGSSRKSRARIPLWSTAGYSNSRPHQWFKELKCISIRECLPLSLFIHKNWSMRPGLSIRRTFRAGAVARGKSCIHGIGATSESMILKWENQAIVISMTTGKILNGISTASSQDNSRLLYYRYRLRKVNSHLIWPCRFQNR